MRKYPYTHTFTRTCMKLSCCYVYLIWSMYTSLCICTRTYVNVHVSMYGTYIKSMYASVCICTLTYTLYRYVCMVYKYIHQTLVMFCFPYIKTYTYVYMCTSTYACTGTYVWYISTYTKPSACYVSLTWKCTRTYIYVNVRMHVHVRMYGT